MPSCRGGLAEDAAGGGEAGAASRGGDAIPAELANAVGADRVAVRALKLGGEAPTLADAAASAAPGRASTDRASDEVVAGAPASVGTMPGNSVGDSMRRASVASARSASTPSGAAGEAPRRRRTTPNTAAAATSATTSAAARLFTRRLGGGGGGSLVAWIVGGSDAGKGVARLDAGTSRPLDEFARASSTSLRALELEILLAPR